MKIHPEIKQLRKERRFLEKIIEKQMVKLAYLEEKIKKTRVRYYQNFIRYFINELTPKEQKILSLRFGFENGESHTYEDVGKSFWVSREIIMQVEAKALDKFRWHSKEEVTKLEKLRKDLIGEVKEVMK